MSFSDSGVLDYREPEWVAEKLGLDKNTVYKYLQEGWLPGVQLGRKWLISERLLAEHLAKETRTQTDARRKIETGAKVLPQTPRLSRVLQLASTYASGRGQDFVGTEHLVIGLEEEAENVAFAVLGKLGVDPDQPRRIFDSKVPVAKGRPREGLPLTPRSQNALRLAQEQAIAMGHSYIGCEHLLLGILEGETGVGFEILRELGVSYEKARAEVMKLVKGRE
jgi:excisionase family DNA binding protein